MAEYNAANVTIDEAEGVAVLVGDSQYIRGQDGVSPVVAVEEIPGGHIVTITDKTHPQGQTFDVMDGAPGVTYTPTVSTDGEISWTNDGGLPNPQPRNIMGPQGQDGSPGQPGRDGADGPAGKSAYESAQDGGYSGTEAQFNTDLAGVSGKQNKINASGILKGDGSGGVSAAAPGTDYVPSSDYDPDSKTAAMTQPVGKDTNCKLWTEPGGGGTDVPLSVVNGKICITFEEVS